MTCRWAPWGTPASAAAEQPSMGKVVAAITAGRTAWQGQAPSQGRAAGSQKRSCFLSTKSSRLLDRPGSSACCLLMSKEQSSFVFMAWGNLYEMLVAARHGSLSLRPARASCTVKTYPIPLPPKWGSTSMSHPLTSQLTDSKSSYVSLLLGRRFTCYNPVHVSGKVSVY